MRRTAVRGVGGVFSGCFAQFLAWKDEGKKMQKQHFNKIRGEIREKKPGKVEKVDIAKITPFFILTPCLLCSGPQFLSRKSACKRTENDFTSHKNTDLSKKRRIDAFDCRRSADSSKIGIFRRVYGVFCNVQSTRKTASMSSNSKVGPRKERESGVERENGIKGRNW